MSKTDAARRPVIGITAGRKILETSVGPLAHFTLPVYYAKAVLAVGGVPIILPPTEGWREEVLMCTDGLLITGGEDVDPAQYGQTRHPTVEKVDPLRDQFEIAVARFALDRDWPLLGICRGSQVINVAAGGTLVQDLPSLQPGLVVHRQPELTTLAHEVEIAPHSRLRVAIGATRIRTNSTHHQAVQAIAPVLRPVAWADDGVIEGTESPTHRWIVAVQWHPEMLYENEPAHRRLFEALVEAARQTHRHQEVTGP